TKYFAVSILSPVSTVPIIPHVFHLTYVENTGAAFSIFAGKQIFLIIITFIFMVIIAYFFYVMPKTKRYFDINIALSLILSGAIGNLIDRIRLNYVIDFFDVRLIGFAIFNIADILVVSGCILVVISVFRNKDLLNDPPSLKKKRQRKAPIKKDPLAKEKQEPPKKDSNILPLDKNTVSKKTPQKHRQNLEPKVMTKIEKLPEHYTTISFDPTPPDDASDKTAEK
ncbi:MAG: signal peptidase II, partial [Eubacterium sp.]